MECVADKWSRTCHSLLCNVPVIVKAPESLHQVVARSYGSREQCTRDRCRSQNKNCGVLRAHLQVLRRAAARLIAAEIPTSSSVTSNTWLVYRRAWSFARFLNDSRLSFALRLFTLYSRYMWSGARRSHKDHVALLKSTVAQHGRHELEKCSTLRRRLSVFSAVSAATEDFSMSPLGPGVAPGT